MSEPGWGWALTRFGNPSWKIRSSAPINDLRLAERNETGLTVVYPGIFVTGDHGLLSFRKVTLCVRGPEQTPMEEWCFELDWHR